MANGGKRPHPVQMPAERQVELCAEVLELMSVEALSMNKAVNRVIPKYGISRATAYRILALNGYTGANLTPEYIHRRTLLMVRSSRLYSLQEKQAIVNRLMALAELEATEIESEYLETRKMTEIMGRRVSRAIATMNRGLNIDERLVRAGIPIAGYTVKVAEPDSETGEKAPPQSIERLLEQARRRRDELQAKQEEIA